MKNINEIVSTPNGTGTTRERKPLTEDQVDAVGYFFARVRVIYGHQYQVNYPDESTEAFVKREFARQVCDLTRDQMDEGFHILHQQRQQNPRDWEYLNMDKVIGLVKTRGKHWQQRVIEAKNKEIEERPKRLEQKRTPEQQAKHEETLRDLRKLLRSTDNG